MSKGERTHTTILDRATSLASQLGLTGLTIGALADDLRLSKSGLFAHFRSKEALQVQVLEHAAARFVETVVRPALQAPRGAPRLRALFERWIAWERDEALPGGCPFIGAATELDDRPGPVRERLVAFQRDWIGVLATCCRRGIEAGLFRADAEPDQFAQDLSGVMLAFHFHTRLMGEPQAETRARRAFDTLLQAVQA